MQFSPHMPRVVGLKERAPTGHAMHHRAYTTHTTAAAAPLCVAYKYAYIIIEPALAC